MPTVDIDDPGFGTTSILGRFRRIQIFAPSEIWKFHSRPFTAHANVRNYAATQLMASPRADSGLRIIVDGD